MCFSKLFRKKENNMQYTENLELNLPEDTDYIETTSREAINDNFEILDKALMITSSGTYTSIDGITNYWTKYSDGRIVITNTVPWSTIYVSNDLATLCASGFYYSDLSNLGVSEVSLLSAVNTFTTTTWTNLESHYTSYLLFAEDKQQIRRGLNGWLIWSTAQLSGSPSGLSFNLTATSGDATSYMLVGKYSTST